MEDVDVWRAANLLIQQHGESAGREAARLGGLAVGKGDPEGERMWVEILKAVRALMKTKPPGPLN